MEFDGESQPVRIFCVTWFVCHNGVTQHGNYQYLFNLLSADNKFKEIKQSFTRDYSADCDRWEVKLFEAHIKSGCGRIMMAPKDGNYIDQASGGGI